MSAYLLRRFGQGLLVLWAAFTLTFFLLQVLPGDAVLIKFQNPDLGLSPAQIADMRLAYGADSPLWRQYLHTLLAMLHGDFGYSLQAGLAVSSLIASNLPDTLSLALPAFLLAVILAFTLAFASRLPGLRWLSNLLQSLPVLFISLPTFWLGIALIQLFSFQLRWIPVINPGPLEGLILPVIAVALPISAPLAQILMRSMDQVAVQPFVAVARAKGMSETGVLWRHVMGNALLPALNIAGLLLGELIAGALITETVFGRSGLGQLTQQAVNNQDIAVLQAVVMISALGFVLINLLVDLVMPRLDPRLQLQTGGVSLVDYAIAVRRRPEWRRVRLQPGLWLAWAVMITALLMALAPQWFTSANPLEGIPGAQRLAPQAHYWLGTDQLGRDLWTRVVYGAVHSLSAALIAVAIGLVVGTALGTLAGALAGRVESTLMRLVDVLLAIPSLLLQLTVIILLGFGTVNAAVAVGVAAIASFARLARAEVVRVRHSDYVEAARGSGGTFLAIFWRHILPNSLTAVLAFATLQFGQAMLALATLSFLGYGTPPPVPEWGLLIAEGRNYLSTAWWLTTFPGLAVVAVVLAANRLSRQWSGVRP